MSITVKIVEEPTTGFLAVIKTGWVWYYRIGYLWPVYLGLAAMFFWPLRYEWAYGEVFADYALIIVQRRDIMIFAYSLWGVVSFLVATFLVHGRITWQTVEKSTQTNCDNGFREEKMKPGSALGQAEPPSFQCKVFGLVDGVPYRAGQAFRVGNYLFTAHHVVDGYQTIRLMRRDEFIEIQADRFKHLEGDVAVALLSSQEISTLKIASGSFSKFDASTFSGLFAKATGFEHSSLGMVKPHEAFGFVEYTGSTVPGYSGSPYVVGNTIYGMHLGGAVENLGYDGSFMQMLIDGMQESSDEWILEQIGKQRKYNIQRSPYHPDEWRVRVGGRYFVVDADVAEQIETGVRMLPNYRDIEYTEERYANGRQRRFAPEAYEWTQGVNPNFVTRVPSANAPEPEDFLDFPLVKPYAPTPPQQIVNQIIAEKPKPKRAAPKPPVSVSQPGPSSSTDPAPAPRKVSSPPPETRSSKPMVLDMGGPLSTPVQLNAVLADISMSIKQLKQELASLQQANSKKLSKKPEFASTVGRATMLRDGLSKFFD